MTYVPVPIVVPDDTPSPKTRELAGLLMRVIQEYETHHPSVTPGEVRAALRLAQEAGGGGVASARLLTAFLGGLMAFVGLGFFYFRSSGAPEDIPLVAVAIAVMILLGLAVVLKTRKS